MSEQLTLADVEEGQYFRELHKETVDRVLSKTPSGSMRIQHSSGMTTCVFPLYTERTKVELMELVPKDRESDLLKVLEAIDNNGASYLDQKEWDMVEKAIAKHKGEQS